VNKKMKKVAFIGLFLLIGMMMMTPKSTVADNLWETGCANPVETITITSDGPLSYDKSRINAPVGACITIIHINQGSAQHDFEIEDSDANVVFDSPVINDGQSFNITVMTPATEGKYTFYCSVPGHREGGMEGDFIIGEGGSSISGFGLATAFAAFVSLMIVVPQLRRL
jgi:plastocyanin